MHLPKAPSTKDTLVRANRPQAKRPTILRPWGRHDGFKHKPSRQVPHTTRQLLEARAQQWEIIIERCMPQMIQKLETSLSSLANEPSEELRQSHSSNMHGNGNTQDNSPKLGDLQNILEIRSLAVTTFNQAVSQQRYLCLGTSQQHEQPWTPLEEVNVDSYNNITSIAEAWSLEQDTHKKLLHIFKKELESWEKSQADDQKLLKVLNQSQGKLIRKV